jgi:glutamate synthase (ferredoxin)
MFVAQDVREIMAQLGFRTIDEMIGQVDRLEPDPTIEHWKLPNGLNWDALLYKPEPPHPGAAIRHTHGQEHGLENALDNELVRLCEPALERREPVELDLPIRNVNRTVGTMLGHELSKRYGEEGLPEDTIQLRLHGSAGQSFGAFVPRGITLTLSGDANDYTGKGLSGGRLIVFPPEAATFDPATNILVGNVVLYGATGGEAFFRGVAGERFCVRNSGALAVVEGVGDHGCEYMTGGRAVILGPTGSNFAAGMSGGIAWVLDPDNRFPDLCNTGMVELERVEDERWERELRELIEKHHRLTGSERAGGILERWEKPLPQFVQVFPTDYKRALAGVEFGSANEDG